MGPEMLPFRMTPQIQTLMLPFRAGAGLARETMISALTAIKHDREVFLSVLSTFIREPTLDWKKLADMKRRREKVGRGGSSTHDKRTFAQQKIDIVADKLRGIHPSKIAETELKHGQGAANTIIPKVAQHLMGPSGSVRQKLLREGYLSEGAVVDCLLDLATDDSVLAMAYQGWSSWM